MDLGSAPESAGSLAQGNIVLSANIAAAVVVLGSHGALPSQLRKHWGNKARLTCRQEQEEREQ